MTGRRCGRPRTTWGAVCGPHSDRSAVRGAPVMSTARSLRRTLDRGSKRDGPGLCAGARRIDPTSEPAWRYVGGNAQIERFWNVDVPALVLYTAVNVVLSGVKLLRT